MDPASAIPVEAQHAAREAAPWIAKLARVGFVAKAVLYITIGLLASTAVLGLRASAGVRDSTVGSRGAMGELLGAPLGRVLLYIVAAGLLGYAAWRLIEAIMNPLGKRGWRGIAARIRSAGIAIVHLGLAYSALKIATGQLGAARDGHSTQTWTARALATPGGELVLYAIALALVGYGAYQLYRAWRAKLGNELSLGPMSFRTRRLVIGVSRFGIAARGAVFIAAGVALATAAKAHTPSQAKTPAQSLGKLFELGALPFALIAIGLVAYGVYELINARYRRIHVA